MRFSIRQKAIFKEFISTNRNIAVNSTAGSGKSTTLVELTKLLPSSHIALCVAFNKDISEELKKRISDNSVKISTMHSLGLNCIYGVLGRNIKLVEKKYQKLAIEFFSKYKTIEDHKERFKRIYAVVELVDHLRLTNSSFDEYLGIQNRGEIESEENDVARFLEYVNKYNFGKRSKNFMIDFIDMLWLAVNIQGVRFPKFDCVFVDEAQDLSNLQHQIIFNVIKTDGRLVLFGDVNQAIYGFMGANSASFSLLASRENTVALPLDISYRCSKAVVEEARRYCQRINCADNASDGKVGLGILDDVKEGDFVLCRNNSPLISAYFKLIGANLKAYVMGKGDISKNLIKLIEPYKNSSMSALFNGLNSKKISLENDFLSKGIVNFKKIPKYTSFLENIEMIEEISGSCSNNRELLKKIEIIFEPSRDSVMLSSIHKSKGLEAERVFLLRPDLIPSKYAESDTELAQEDNLSFIAITRAKEEFYYLIEGEDEPEECTDEYDDFEECNASSWLSH